MTLSQTPESDEEKVLPPYSPLLSPRDPRRFVLLLNWYPHFSDQSYAPGCNLHDHGWMSHVTVASLRVLLAAFAASRYCLVK